MGGMAEVWKANGPQGAVAIKRLLPHAARNPSIAAAFEREGRLLSRISHPNVIGIHEVARDETGTCLVLEYIEGADLTGIGGASWPGPLRCGSSAICCARSIGVHSLCDEQGRPLGLIHRDLSLGNLLVDIEWSRQTDGFRLGARRLGIPSGNDRDRASKGTLAYLAPEQARGAPVDARTDLFAAGAILYELLAGEPIYNDEDPRIALARARAGDVESLAAARPETPIAAGRARRSRARCGSGRSVSERRDDAAELERVAAMTDGIASGPRDVARGRVPTCWQFPSTCLRGPRPGRR